MNSKHALMMLACCLIPLAGIAAVTIFSVPLTTVVWVGMILLCPLAHLFMMKYMMGNRNSEHEGHSAKEKNQ